MSSRRMRTPSEPDVGVSVRRRPSTREWRVGARKTTPVIGGSSASGSRRRFGSRSSSCVSSTPVSMRARCRPRHMCGPRRERDVLPRRAEDVELLGVVPVALVVVGGADVDRDVEPAGIGTPSTSVSRVAVRMIPSSGGSHRSPSSIACGMRPRSARSASSCSGLVSRPKSRLLDERYVVSAPAGSSNRRNEQISSSSRCSPSSSACTSTEITSSEGCSRRSAMIAAEVLVERVRRGRGAVELEARADHLDGLPVEHRQVFAGRPSIRAMTSTGNGNVSCARGRRAARR